MKRLTVVLMQSDLELSGGFMKWIVQNDLICRLQWD
jgi:hypothetical protein